MKKILLLHGALGCEEQLIPLSDLLANEYEVMNYTFANHGRKAAIQQPFTINSLANDLAEFLREQIIDPIPVFGYSMGGYVALWLARHQPHLIEKVFALGTKINWTIETVEKETKFLVPEMMETKVPAYARYLEDLHGSNWKILVSNTAAMMHNLVQHHITSYDFHQIQQPVVLSLGDGDTMVSRDETENAALMLPHGKFHLFENTLHPIEKINPQLIKAELISFL
jgi:pimeloyl-ACP methyl ester carboxylesterase